MSDNGSQPTSVKYQIVIDLLGSNHVTTSYSNAKGNVETERFMSTFKEEVFIPTSMIYSEELKNLLITF